MTAQIGDRYIFEDNSYTISAISKPIGFDPYDYDLYPVMMSTACHRGYWCNYKITSDGIYLDKLYIHCANNDYPEINGKGIERDANGEPLEYMGFMVYSNLDLKIKYTGEILVGDGFIVDYYRHIGYQKFYSYKVLKEFVFSRGELLEIKDHSKLAADVRQYIEQAVRENDEKFHLIIRRGGGYGRIYAEECLSEEEREPYWWI